MPSRAATPGIRVMLQLASDDLVFCAWVDTTDEEPAPDVTSVEKTFVSRPKQPRARSGDPLPSAPPQARYASNSMARTALTPLPRNRSETSVGRAAPGAWRCCPQQARRGLAHGRSQLAECEHGARRPSLPGPVDTRPDQRRASGDVQKLIRPRVVDLL